MKQEVVSIFLQHFISIYFSCHVSIKPCSYQIISITNNKQTALIIVRLINYLVATLKPAYQNGQVRAQFIGFIYFAALFFCFGFCFSLLNIFENKKKIS